MTQDAIWSERFVTVVAREVRRWRLLRKMSARRLSDACTEIGYPIPRSVLANLESGRRDTITVAELLTLARALDVPPILLIFPVGQVVQVEVLPGVDVDTWEAARWLTGEAPMPGDDPRVWAAQPSAVELYRTHDRLVRDWRDARRMVTGDTEDQVTALLEVSIRRRVEMETSIRRVRADLRIADLQPPPLPPELAHIDDDQGGTDGSTEGQTDSGG